MLMLSNWSGKNWIGGRLPWKKFDVWRSGGRIVDFEILKVFKIFKIFNGCQENQSWPCNPKLEWFSFLGWGLRWRWRWGSISTFNLKSIWRAKWKLTANWNEFDCKDAYWSTHSNCNPILEPKYQKGCLTHDYDLRCKFTWGDSMWPKNHYWVTTRWFWAFYFHISEHPLRSWLLL